MQHADFDHRLSQATCRFFSHPPTFCFNSLSFNLQLQRVPPQIPPFLYPSFWALSHKKSKRTSVFKLGLLTQMVAALANVFQSTRTEHLRTSACSAIARLSRQCPALLATVLPVLGPTQLPLSAAGPRTCQAALTVLTLYLAQSMAFYCRAPEEEQPSFLFVRMPDLGISSDSSLAAPPDLQRDHMAILRQALEVDGGAPIAAALVAGLEHAHVVVKGKSVLAIFLLAFCGIRYLCLCCEHKMCSALERAAKETDTHLVSCLKLLYRLLVIVAEACLSTLAIDLEAGSIPDQTVSNLLPVVHCLTTPSIRTAVTSTALLEWLSRALAAVERPAFPAKDEVRRHLFSIVESIAQDEAILRRHWSVVVTCLLRSLAGMLSSPNGDTRFLCLKLLIDILSQIMSDRELYQAGSKVGSSATVDELVHAELLPRCEALLSDKDPIPLYVL
eukprot:NODE_22_length_3473_cov_62.360981_g20_i0.p1 GENE.NODE_22_length_3473_cov_62.360981_g20_i0~~NODE_22_length_3473_cov_62.360981_g20_i0.p1  ORF type:complete len:445 (+),score=111.84 NODE_22_length_3473_cov_62.360981_g20_i0:1324-2658(+)